MRRRHLATVTAVAMVAGCGTHPHRGRMMHAVLIPPVEYVADTTSTSQDRTSTTIRVNRGTPRTRQVPPSTVLSADPPNGPTVTSTAYCLTSGMADGVPARRGAVAGNWPLGTRLQVSDSPWGPGVFTVEDRIGSGSSLDFAMPGDCAGARRWGRRAVTVVVR